MNYDLETEFVRLHTAFINVKQQLNRHILNKTISTDFEIPSFNSSEAVWGNIVDEVINGR